ncbi:MAG: hypothetical protein K0R31_1987 [Clostridiales bacterium]|jgi:hypothetical protein|nr:hypothetical protein [Clostridiales bacterium]
MNKKLFFNLIYILTGSFIVLIMGSIVTFNFVKDSRLLGSAAVIADKTAPSTQPAKTGQNQDPGKQPGTINYQREVVVTKPKVEKSEDIQGNKPTPTPTPTPTPDPSKLEKIKVEVINRTGAKYAAEDLRKLLAAAGFEASAANGPSDKPVKTEIIERNDKNAGAEVKKVIKIGKVIKQVDPNSKYDVTVIIGDDYLP